MPVPPPDEGHRPAAVALQVEQAEDRHEMADVERWAARIEADVAGYGPRIGQARGQSGVAAWNRPRQRSSSRSPPLTGAAGSPSVRHRRPRRAVKRRG